STQDLSAVANYAGMVHIFMSEITSVLVKKWRGNALTIAAGGGLIKLRSRSTTATTEVSHGHTQDHQSAEASRAHRRPGRPARHVLVPVDQAHQRRGCPLRTPAVRARKPEGGGEMCPLTARPARQRPAHHACA